MLRASLAWLGESNAWSLPASRRGRGVAAALVLGFCGAAFLWRAAPVGAAALLAAGVRVLRSSHGTGGLPPYDTAFAREHLAVIDFSHQPNASKHSAMDTGLHGVSINLLRHGLLPVAANQWDSGSAGHGPLPGPQRAAAAGHAAASAATSCDSWSAAAP